MKICLINPKCIESTELSILHGLLSIAATVKDEGHVCEIIDYNNPDTAISYEYLNTFDVVGFSVMTTQLSHAVEIAQHLDSKVKVVWGGVHCLLDPLSIISKYRKHFVVSGDGETPILKLLDYFSGKEKIENLKAHSGICLYLDQPIINPPYFNKDLNTLADVDFYDLPQLEKYIYKTGHYFKIPPRLPKISILTSRGCSWNCSFCINSIYRKYGAFHRSKSIEKIRRESEKIIKDFNIKLVTIADEDFFVNSSLVEQWQEFALEKKIFWGANCRYNYFKKNMISQDKLLKLRNSGLFYIAMSVEAGDEDLRNSLINKKVSNSDILEAVKTIKESVGDLLAVNTSFIVNFPSDTKKNKIETIKWMEFLSNNINIKFSGPQIYRPYPGSKLYEQEGKHKYGDIDYYISRITRSGELKIIQRHDFASYFYSLILPYYYNKKFRFFRLQGDNTYNIIEPQPNIGLVLLCLFFTIKLRLKFNCWKFFYEPLLIGWLIAVTKRNNAKNPGLLRFLARSKLLKRLMGDFMNL